MQLRAQVVVNGVQLVASTTTNWELVHDGKVRLRMPTGIWRRLVEFDSEMQTVDVEIQVSGLVTMEELESRLRGVERAVGHDLESVWARRLGLWLPRPGS